MAKKQVTESYIFEKYNLSDVDKKIIQYKLQFPEIKQEELAILCKSNRVYINRRLHTEVVKKALSEFDTDWKANIIKAKEKASRKLIKHIDNPNPAISIRACEQILQLDKANIGELDGEQGGIKFEGWDD